MAIYLTASSPDLDFAGQGLVPLIHKGAFCGEGNISPELTFTLVNANWGMMESANLQIVDLDASGTGFAGYFKHWDVDLDPPSSGTQWTIGQNIVWGGELVAVNPTDYAPGTDGANGYNGPCCPDPPTGHTYAVILQVVIREIFESSANNWGNTPAGVTGNTSTHRIQGSPQPYFTDNNLNLTPEITTGNCGDTVCPQGYTPNGDSCRLVEYTTYSVEGVLPPIQKGQVYGQYNDLGAHIYDGAYQYYDPVGGSPELPLLVKNSNITNQSGTALNLVADTDGSAPWDTFNQLNQGRLNIAGLWTDVGNCTPNGECFGSGSSDCQPMFHWLGFAVCINVPSTGVYCIGAAADNNFRMSINGTQILRTEQTRTNNFKRWWIIEWELQAGVNVIELEGENDSQCAAFAAEIYDANATTLSGINSEAALDNVILWSTKDMLDPGSPNYLTAFNLGQNLPSGPATDYGFDCPEGYAVDACGSNECIRITDIEGTLIECCWLIENCADPNDTYLIKRASTDTINFYVGDVYSFDAPKNNGVFYSEGSPKCFTLIGEEVCPLADVEEVSVTTAHGTGNCSACDGSIQFTKCEGGDIIYVTLAQGHPTLVEGNVYNLDAVEGCWTAGAPTVGEDPDYEDVTGTDLGSADCSICLPCLTFRDCYTADDTTVQLATEDASSLIPGNTYALGGEDAEITDVPCWQFIEEVDCTETPPAFTDVTIETDNECLTCEGCTDKYIMTNCADETDTEEVIWNPADTPPDTGLVHVFTFDPSKCWTLQYVPFDGCDTPVEEQTPTYKSAAPAPQEPLFVDSACIFEMMETLDWVNSGPECDYPGGCLAEYQIDYFIYNGTEYIDTFRPFFSVEWGSVNGFDDVANAIPSDFITGQTYTDQVDAINAIFAEFGLQNELVAQVATVSSYAGIAGYYILYDAAKLTEFQMAFHDRSGWRHVISIDGGGANYDVQEGLEFTSQPLYSKSSSCLDAEDVEFEIVDNVVVETEY